MQHLWHFNTTVEQEQKTETTELFVETNTPSDTVTPSSVTDTTAKAASMSSDTTTTADSDTTAGTPQSDLSIPSDAFFASHHSRIRGVYSWEDCFPDIQDTQIVAAQKNGIPPLSRRSQVSEFIRAHRLVDISNSPYYILDDLDHSMPYLVPKAQHLLNTICMNFIDSLQMKGIRPHLPMITSVLRTVEDVSKLQHRNGNATTNSCHCYGTTVDISYNRFMPITGKYDERTPMECWNFEMKQILAEVLYDIRRQQLCYVKYEKRQGCFHLTIR